MTEQAYPAPFVSVDAPATELADLLATADGTTAAVFGSGSTPPAAPVARALVAALAAPGAATASPVPAASATSARTYEVHSAGPPPASLPLPCPRLGAIDLGAVRSIGWEPTGGTVADALGPLGERLHHHGWRHVSAPGVALSWDAAAAESITPTAGWTARAVRSLAGSANAGLEAHTSWAAAQLDGVRVVVDGACMASAPYTGTQHVVLEVSRWLSRTRPTATVVLATPAQAVNQLRSTLAGDNVQVVDRAESVTADVLYRPYQMLYAGELPFVMSTGRRALVGQLDMIGFSNPAYHPTDQLLFFARNMQRHLMRVLDGVTFISAFGRETAFAECPDLDRDRLHVVSCGADPDPLPGALRPERGIDATTPLITCLSSTFWHKNRAHAIRTFAELVARHGYTGHLVITGPEPYYGRSLAVEDALLAGLAPDVAARVHRWGQVDDDEKWWLLRHAQVVLYPSVVEGFGLVPFEAAAVGTPCLVPAQTATAELLGHTPVAVSSWDPVEWARRAAELFDTAAAAEAVAALVEAAGRHTWERCAIATWDAIDHALAAPRRSIHDDDGGRLVQIGGRSSAPGARWRFDAARGMPAVRRRVTRLVSRNRADGDA